VQLFFFFLGLGNCWFFHFTYIKEERLISFYTFGKNKEKKGKKSRRRKEQNQNCIVYIIPYSLPSSMNNMRFLYYSDVVNKCLGARIDARRVIIRVEKIKRDDDSSKHYKVYQITIWFGDASIVKSCEWCQFSFSKWMTLWRPGWREFLFKKINK
jgi:hypothetical protein